MNKASLQNKTLKCMKRTIIKCSDPDILRICKIAFRNAKQHKNSLTPNPKLI